MFKRILELFFGKPAEPTVAPYKVEAPAFKPTADAAPIEETPTPGNNTVSTALPEQPVVPTTPLPSVPEVAKQSKAPAAKKSAGTRKPAAKKPAAKKSTPTP
jgi:hypothetical protein